MRVLIAPDSFGGTLTAVEAAEAIASGWRRRAPADELVLAPMSAGGAGFVDVVHANVGGDLVGVVVRSARGVDAEPMPATVLVVDDIAYVECAQVSAGGSRGDAETATSYGVGQLIDAALAAGARTVVVGLADFFVGDGGAGVLAALGAASTPSDALLGGPRALATLDVVELVAVHERVAGAAIVGARDLDIPLLGLRGTTNLTGAARGLPADRLQAVDAQLERLADATDRRLAGAQGAGAGGGVGFAILLAGGTCVDGVSVTADAIGLATLARSVDLVVTGEGSFDFESRSGTVPGGVAAVAGQAVRPCIALAGRVLVGARETRALGVESAYAVDDLVGVDEAANSPAESLAALAERVARTWSR
ncbi:MAG TPA: glycerate kinase [Nocardioidaceae bacterium]|nr:glycerate kinase [Nocardioidaceae bacterium]